MKNFTLIGFVAVLLCAAKVSALSVTSIEVPAAQGTFANGDFANISVEFLLKGKLSRRVVVEDTKVGVRRGSKPGTIQLILPCINAEQAHALSTARQMGVLRAELLKRESSTSEKSESDVNRIGSRADMGIWCRTPVRRLSHPLKP